MSGFNPRDVIAKLRARPRPGHEVCPCPACGCCCVRDGACFGRCDQDGHTAEDLKVGSRQP